ncbi:RTA-like protein [Amylocarpus encephaloides]|uniref:RTA-like protein n=1 Tax=Amylocarpus encephaloides TaxID=45428 RepID=A0A9P7YCP2_9HELO|nr:RTA-like protein [Amylocarpus encephaloides]
MAEEKFSIWAYSPSIPAAAIFAVLFAGTTGFHGFQAFKKRSLFFIPFIIGGIFEAVGYVGRIIAHNNQTSIGIYIMQTLLLLVAPALYAASVYMTLGRIMLHTRGEHLSPIKRTLLTKIFVIGDVFSFLVQSGGGGLMAQEKSQNLGKNIVLIGLVLQILFFGLFIVTSLLFHVRLQKNPTAQSVDAPWKKYMFSLYFASILILIRSLFRVAEFQGGHDGPLMKKEVYLYIFDSVLMLGVSVVFNVVHPGNLIGSRKVMQDSMPLA